jgi:hypothetical protein
MLAAGLLVTIAVLGIMRWRRPDRALDLARPQAWANQFVVNLPWLEYGLDFGKVPAWGARGVASRSQVYEAQLRALKNVGVRSVSWFLLADGRGTLRFDGEGNPVGFDETFWSDYDAAIGLARRLDLNIVWVLMDQLWMSPRRTIEVSGKEAVSVGGHASVLEAPAQRRAFLERALRPLFARHAGEPGIAGWILLNEPDNPMTKGWVSKVAVHTFIEEMVQLARQVAPDQRLGVAFNDLESLAVAASDRALEHLDFVVFHHYARELPVPASHLRQALRMGAQPIYIGEFDLRIAQDPSSMAAFLRWTHALGYDGAWPWSLNAPRDEAEAPLAAIAQIQSAQQATAATSQVPARPADFGKRRTSPEAKLGASGPDWQRWLADGAKLLERETPATSLAERRRELTQELSKLEKVVAEQAGQLETDVVRCIAENRGWLDRAAGEERERAQLALAGCEQHKQRSMAWKLDAEARIAEVRGLFIDLERKEWRRKLYVPFWTEELAWATRAGLQPARPPGQ